jgi:hypothetical protein
MNERRDELMHEVAGLMDPVLPAARAQQIQELARARFLGGMRARADRAPRGRVPDLVVAALLSACVAAYLTWTAVTVASLQASPHGVLFQRASAGARR